MILDYSLELGLDLLAFHGAHDVDEVPGAYSAVEREALACVPRTYWILLESMPLFHFSQILRALEAR